MGNPPVTSDTFWVVYLGLLNKFEATSISAEVKSKWNTADEEAFEVKLMLLQGQQLLGMAGQVIQSEGDELFESGSSDGEDFSNAEYGLFCDSSQSVYASFSDEDEDEVASMIIEP